MVSLIGAPAVSAGLICALWASVHAFGGAIALGPVACVLLFGSTAGNAIPMPGGLGTMDAAPAAGLVTAEVSLQIALPAVALHRLPPCGCSFRPAFSASSSSAADDSSEEFASGHSPAGGRSAGPTPHLVVRARRGVRVTCRWARGSRARGTSS